MLEELKEIIGRAMPDLDTSAVTENTRLIEELGFDSLAMMMMAMEIEDRYGFRFTEFVRFETAGDVCAYIESKIS